MLYCMFWESPFLGPVVEGIVDDAVGGKPVMAGDSDDACIVPAAVAEVGPLARRLVSLLLPRFHFQYFRST